MSLLPAGVAPRPWNLTAAERALGKRLEHTARKMEEVYTPAL